MKSLLAIICVLSPLSQAPAAAQEQLPPYYIVRTVLYEVSAMRQQTRRRGQAAAAPTALAVGSVSAARFALDLKRAAAARTITITEQGMTAVKAGDTFELAPVGNYRLEPGLNHSKLPRGAGIDSSALGDVLVKIHVERTSTDAQPEPAHLGLVAC